MIEENRILMGKTEEGKGFYILPEMANRHGMICGATGSGKTVSLKVMAEGFSAMGVPVFLSDVKGDLSGMAECGVINEKLGKRIDGLGLSGFSFDSFPVVFWDVYGKSGIPLRTTISEMGPLLLSRILELSDIQSQILSVVFKIADDENLLLIDTKDLKSMLAHVSENSETYEPSYGKMSSQSIAAITRAVVALEAEGGEEFFGEPALSVADWFSTDERGYGLMHILDASSLIQSPKLYATFLLWLLSELFELLPEAGDLEKPKLVFFFDEAHMLFNSAPKPLIDKIDQVVKLIRSKGVGIYFCTQNPSDIPDSILSQLSNKLQHAMHAYSPAEQKGVRAAAQAYPKNPEFDTFEAILSLGIGEAVVSFLDENGVPGIAQRAKILPPQSLMKAAEPEKRKALIQNSGLYLKYKDSFDPDSAYEFLQRRGMEAQEARKREQQEKEEEKEQERLRREEEKERAKALKEEEKEKERIRKEEEKAAKDAWKAKQKEFEERSRIGKRAIKSLGNTVAGTVGREVGKELTKNMGPFGKRLGGNTGASIGRGLLSTFLRL